MFKKTLVCAALALASVGPVTGFANTDTNAPTVKTQLSDSAVTAKVKAKFAMSPVVKALNVSVTTTNGDVALAGTVATDMEYERAVALAESVDGVSDVNADNLKVTSSKSPMGDTYITAKVKGSLLKERLFGDKEVEYWPVSVETKNGVVYLTGTVDTAEQQNNIAKVVQGIKGVKSVQSTITVK